MLMNKWLIHSVDDDQALMWNATAAYAHFMFPEPCFWGQAYGIMLEAILAVPLYWLNVPLNIALPTATIIIGAAAYLYVSFLLVKEGHVKTACVVMASYLLMSWRWDVLTSVPRCYISGMSLAVLGSIRLNNGKTKHSAFYGAFLCVLSVIMTSTAAAVVGIGYLYYALRIKNEFKRTPAVAGGTAAGMLLYILVKNFYVINAEYNLHPSPELDISRTILINNLHRLPGILSDFIFFNNGWVVLLLFAAVFIYAFITKRWNMLALLLFDAFLMFFLLGLRKTTDYIDRSVTFSQTRMFLCWSYSLLPIAYFWANEEKPERAVFSARVRSFFEKPLVQAAAGTVLLLIVIGANLAKLNMLEKDILSPESGLRKEYPNCIYTTEEIVTECKRADEQAALAGADTVITGDRRALTYAFDALYFGKYTVYNCIYDRRTWNYTAMLERSDRNCLFVSGTCHEPINYKIIIFSEEDEYTPVQYFEKEYGYRRRP